MHIVYPKYSGTPDIGTCWIITPSWSCSKTTEISQNIWGVHNTGICYAYSFAGRIPRNISGNAFQWHDVLKTTPNPQQKRFLWHNSRGSYAIKVCVDPFSLQKGKGFMLFDPPLALWHVLGHIFCYYGVWGLSKLFSASHAKKFIRFSGRTWEGPCLWRHLLAPKQVVQYRCMGFVYWVSRSYVRHDTSHP